MEYERFLIEFLKFSLYWILFCLDPNTDPYHFCLDQDPFQSSVWNWLIDWNPGINMFCTVDGLINEI